METANRYIVITTINPKSKGIKTFERFQNWHIVLVGDEKSVPIRSTKNTTFLSLKDQRELGYRSAQIGPLNHYARKNIGYLYAIQQGAEIIYDTDDDNLPYDSWKTYDFSCHRLASSDSKYINVYRYFTDELVWPRGYPLDEIHHDEEICISSNHQTKIGVWQGLADIEPDVDAIFRLIFNKKITFKEMPPISLAKHRFCPFNSQNTLWNYKAFPFLYLPSTVRFRFTDILRGYIAQRLMWKHDLYLGFTKATVYQNRNAHDLMEDFKSELDCYTCIKKIVDLLEKLDLSHNSIDNLELVYTNLLEEKLVKPEELSFCRAWIHDLMMINPKKI